MEIEPVCLNQEIGWGKAGWPLMALFRPFLPLWKIFQAYFNDTGLILLRD